MATNWEYIKAAIDGEIDDGGASEESAIFYHIACPHRAGEHTLCDDEGISRDVCVRCKAEWLEEEYE